jgi:hypothetical protein
MFAGHVVSARPLVGLARREGWQIESYEGLARSIDGHVVKLALGDNVYPGADGWTTTGDVTFWTDEARRSVRVPMNELPAVSLSEALRSVDLLVSASGFAVTPPDDWSALDLPRQIHLSRLVEGPLSPMSEMRRAALERALVGRDGMADLRFDARHLLLGPYAIHLATGRVTRDGEPVVVEPDAPSLAAVPWLPYDEKLLGLIANTALILARS